MLLHGVNTVYKRPPYCPPDEPGGFTAADADLMVELGFNAVRLGSLFVGVMPERGEIDEGYLDCVERVFDLLSERGI